MIDVMEVIIMMNVNAMNILFRTREHDNIQTEFDIKATFYQYH